MGALSPAATLPAMAEPDADSPTDPSELEPPELAAMLSAREAQLVDVRDESEHAAGHVSGALHIPIAQLSERAGEIARDRPVVLYCRGGDRSAVAAEALRASGFEAYSMSGGLLAWAEGGLPLEPADGTVAPRSALPGVQ